MKTTLSQAHWPANLGDLVHSRFTQKIKEQLRSATSASGISRNLGHRLTLANVLKNQVGFGVKCHCPKPVGSGT